MKRLFSITFILAISFFCCLTSPLRAGAGETRGYTEEVTVPVSGGDEHTALVRAKGKAKEQALKAYVQDVYGNLSETPDLGGDDKYIADIKVLESKASGFFSKELKASIRVWINEEAVRDYLKRQGAVKGRGQERRVFVVLIPGKMDTGDAEAVLDNVRAEVRKVLTAAEFTVIDSEEQTKRLESLVEGQDYSMVSQLEGLGEWVVLGKVETQVSKDESLLGFHTLITGKAVTITSRDLLWEDNIDGFARSQAGEPPLVGLRGSSINGGQEFATRVLGALQSKGLTSERRGSRYEFVFNTGGSYKLERKILRLLKEDIPGLKNVSEKNRGKGAMELDLYYAGKIADLVDFLLDNFEKDTELARFSPEIEGNRVNFK